MSEINQNVMRHGTVTADPKDIQIPLLDLNSIMRFHSRNPTPFDDENDLEAARSRAFMMRPLRHWMTRVARDNKHMGRKWGKKILIKHSAISPDEIFHKIYMNQCVSV